MRTIPSCANRRGAPLAACIALTACVVEPALRHGGVPMPLELEGPSAQRPPSAVVALEGTRACLGTLITPRLVLTAAHCVVDGARHSHVRVGLGVRRTPIVISACRVHPAAYGAPTPCESAPAGRLRADHDLALLDLMDPVPPGVARSLAVLIRQPRRLRRGPVLVVSRHATEMQSQGPWRVSEHTVVRVQGGRMVTRPLARRAWLSTRPGDSGGPALLARGGALFVVGALSGGRTAWSADSRFAATFEPENGRWIAEAVSAGVGR